MDPTLVPGTRFEFLFQICGYEHAILRIYIIIFFPTFILLDFFIIIILFYFSFGKVDHPFLFWVLELSFWEVPIY